MTCFRSFLFWLLPLLSFVGPLAADGAPVALDAPGVTLRASAWDQITIGNEQGEALMTFTDFALKWEPTLVAKAGTVRRVENDGGAPVVEVDYSYPLTKSGDRISVTGRFTLRADCVDVRYTIRGAPEGSRLGGSMFGRKFSDEAEALPVVKLGLLKRHEHGGIPMEHADGRFLPYRIKGNLLVLAFDGRNKFNPQWADGAYQHTGLSQVAPGVYETSFSVLFPPREWPFDATAARWHGRPVALRIDTGRAYNWWESADDPFAFNVTLVNTTNADRAVSLSHRVKNFAGETVSSGRREIILPVGRPVTEGVSFTAKTTRDIFFAEVSATDAATGEEVFSRANLVFLPPHDFKSTPEDSVIGISAGVRPYPSRNDMRRLLQRLGVRWLRHGNTHEHEGIVAIRHDNIDLGEQYTDDARDALIRRTLQRCIDEGNPVWELTNEINYGSLHIGMGDTIKGERRARTIAVYVDWLKAIRRIQAEMGPKAEAVKILSTGLAGMDVGFVEALHEAGGWELIDGIALHPGRGNFTPDYPVYDPSTRSVSWHEWRLGAHGSYWNYYGSVLTAKQLIARYGGDKELWLTEVYSPGWYNSFWDDSPRHGAENAILSFALAHAEGVRSAMWYQIFDGVWWDPLGVNPEDREYFFGMIKRDGSPKPVFMSICTIAEALDQAKFKGWIAFPSETTSKARGLHFETPRGPMSVLWDRSDGYVLTEKRPDFATPEAWVDTWKTRTPVTLRTRSNEIRVINVIGQERVVPASNGEVVLELTGAPVIVYGLDAPLLEVNAN